MGSDPILLMQTRRDGAGPLKAAALASGLGDEQIVSLRERETNEMTVEMIGEAEPLMVVGDFEYGLHEKLGTDPNYMMVMRDPYDRVIRDYMRTLQSPYGTRFYHAAHSTMVEWSREFGNRMMSLVVGDKLEGEDKLRAEHIKLAYERIREDFLFAGLYDRINEAARWLSDRFGARIPVPTTPDHDELPDGDRMSMDVLGKIKTNVFFDWELYAALEPSIDRGVNDLEPGPQPRDGATVNE